MTPEQKDRIVEAALDVVKTWDSTSWTTKTATKLNELTAAVRAAEPKRLRVRVQPGTIIYNAGASYGLPVVLLDTHECIVECESFEVLEP